MEVKSTVNEVIGIAKEVRGFWAKLAEMFGANVAPVPQGKSPQPVAKKVYVAAAWNVVPRHSDRQTRSQGAD